MMNALDQIISSAGMSRTGTSSTVSVDAVAEPVVVDQRHAVARAVDQVHDVLAAVGLGQPVRERHVRLAAVGGEHRQRALDVARVDEEVEVLGVARDAGVALERVGPAHQERDRRGLAAGASPADRSRATTGSRPVPAVLMTHRAAGAGRLAATGISNTRKVGWSGKGRAQHGDRDVVDRAPGRGASLGAAVMRVAVDDEGGAVAVDGILQSAGAKERQDLGRLGRPTVARIGE